MSPPPAASATPTLQTPSCRAFTGRPSRAATSSPRSAPTATAFTPSRRPPTPTRRSPSRISLATPAPAATKACACRRSSAYPANRVTSYFDSYHGLAAEGGSVVAANCSSCHGVHDILPSSDPRSTINRANLDATCGKCHKGVTQKFTRTPVHLQDGVRSKRHRFLAVRWVRWIYIPLILARHRRHVPAQRHHLAQQGRRAPAHAESLHAAHDRESALAASGSAQ